MVEKKHIKIGIATLAVTTLVIGLSVGITESQKQKKNMNTNVANVSTSMAEYSTYDNSCASGYSGKSGKSDGYGGSAGNMSYGTSGNGKSGKSGNRRTLYVPGILEAFGDETKAKGPDANMNQRMKLRNSLSNAQDEVDPSFFSSVEPVSCTCTPNSYTFQLNFDGTCAASTIGASDGVDVSICFLTEGGSPGNLDVQNLNLGAPPARGRRMLSSNVLGKAGMILARGSNTDEEHRDEDKWMDKALSGVDFTRELQHAQLFAFNNINDKVERGRNLQLDTVVTTITSVTFLETDTTPALNIINQDSTYFDFSGTDGQLLEYESVSARLDPTVPLSDQIENVPGGVILILFGVNAANEVIQNTVAWIYTLNYCDEVPLSPGAEVGWVTLESFDPPYSEFCDAATDPPTLTPSKSPTLTPSKSPTSKSGKREGKSKSGKSSCGSYYEKICDIGKSGKSGSVTNTNALVSAQADEEQCSCSPQKFIFKLALSATCPPLPPPFPPNDVFGAGVKDYTCSIAPEPFSTSNSPDVIPLDLEELEWSSANFLASGNFIEPAEGVDTQPVSIYSILFLEVDSSFNVINQDSSYVRDIDFVSGDVFNYTSIGANNLGVVPGGLNMVLRGVNAAGEPVRNVFTITYTNDCGVPTFENGDAIGWVVFENSVPATEESCTGSQQPTSMPTQSKSGKSGYTNDSTKSGKASYPTTCYEGTQEPPKPVPAEIEELEETTPSPTPFVVSLETNSPTSGGTTTVATEKTAEPTTDREPRE